MKKNKTLTAFFCLLGIILILGTAYASDREQNNNSNKYKSQKEQQLEEALQREQRLQEIFEAQEQLERENKLKAEKMKARNKILNHNCTQAKSRLEALMTTGRVRIKTNEDTKVLSNEEKLDEIKATEEAIKKYCVD